MKDFEIMDDQEKLDFLFCEIKRLWRELLKLQKTISNKP